MVSEDLSGEIQGESEESQLAEPSDDAEARADFWSIQGDLIHRHHTEPRVQLHVPKEETFPIPLKDIDATRPTHADLDVTQEKKIDDIKYVAPATAETVNAYVAPAPVIEYIAPPSAVFYPSFYTNEAVTGL